MNKAVKFFRLSLYEQAFVIKCYLLLWFIRVSLWIFPFSLTQKILNLITPKNVTKINTDAVREKKIIWTVMATSRYVPKATCLTQALVSHLLLLREGFDVQIRYGVMRDDNGSFKAHAWVENNGDILIGYNKEFSKYKPLSAPSHNYR